MHISYRENQPFSCFLGQQANANLCFLGQQTNTSDMLDLAVDYIKDLQNEFKVTKDYSYLILLY